MEIAALPHAQRASTEMAEGALEIWGLAEWSLAAEALPEHLRFLVGFSPSQQERATSKPGLPFLEMSPAQQQRFLSLSLGGKARPSQEALAGARLRVSYSPPADGICVERGSAGIPLWPGLTGYGNERHIASHRAMTRDPPPISMREPDKRRLSSDKIGRGVPVDLGEDGEAGQPAHQPPGPRSGCRLFRGSPHPASFTGRDGRRGGACLNNASTREGSAAGRRSPRGSHPRSCAAPG